MSKKEVKIKTKGNLQDVLNHLEDVVRFLKSGKVTISKNGDTLTLVPEGVVCFELEAQSKKGKEKIEFEIEWKKGEADYSEEDTLFSIT